MAGSPGPDDKRIECVVSGTRLTTMALTRPDGREDLTGRRFGRLEVIGAAVKAPGSKAPGLWVCRCVCGNFVQRRARAVRNPTNSSDGCERCRQMDFLQRQAEFEALGYNPEVTENADASA